MEQVKYLVISGGGAAGCAYAGAFEELSKVPGFSFDNIKGVAGTSVGAIAALIISLNFTPQEASNLLLSLDLKKIKDGGCPVVQIYRLFTQYGKFKGAALSEFICKIIQTKTGRSDPQNITFADLHRLGFKDLHIVAAKLYKENKVPTGKQKIFSYEKTPETSVLAALHASAAAPLYFMRVRLKKVQKGKYVIDESGDLFDDGGLLNNFPIDLFDKPQYLDLPRNDRHSILNPHTLGLALRMENEIRDENHPRTKEIIEDANPVDYVKSIINSLLLQFNKQKLDQSWHRERTIQIDRKNVKIDDFNMSQQTKALLVESGKEAVRNYFEHKKIANDVVFEDKSPLKSFAR